MDRPAYPDLTPRTRGSISTLSIGTCGLRRVLRPPPTTGRSIYIYLRMIRCWENNKTWHGRTGRRKRSRVKHACLRENDLVRRVALCAGTFAVASPAFKRACFPLLLVSLSLPPSRPHESLLTLLVRPALPSPAQYPHPIPQPALLTSYLPSPSSSLPSRPPLPSFPAALGPRPPILPPSRSPNPSLSPLIRSLLLSHAPLLLPASRPLWPLAVTRVISPPFPLCRVSTALFLNPSIHPPTLLRFLFTLPLYLVASTHTLLEPPIDNA